MEWQVKQTEGTYILRYYLSGEPCYDEEITERRMEELIEFCLQYKISAVMLYVDLNPFWYYMPDTIEHTEYYVGVVKRLAEKLRMHSISYQLNYQNLFGSWDGNADLRYVNEWENYVDECGLESKGCACSLGKVFREKAGAKLRLWSETQPDVIWIDDDIRFHNHRTSIESLWTGKISKERLDFGCFCDAHIALFNEKERTSYTREEIVQGILSGAKQNELRRKWFKFSGECAAEVTEWIEHVIHASSPSTRVAVMTSIPDVHSVEGRHWGTFLEKLSGNGRALLRPTFGPYAESDPKNFFESWMVLEQLKADINYQYNNEFDFCPEIENTRFTRWSKSLAATGYQIMLSAFAGCKGVTLSIYDLEGCVLQEEAEFGELLESRRLFADQMAKMDLWNWKNEGIGLLTAPGRLQAPYNKTTAGQMEGLQGRRLWDKTLLQAGIPCRYITPNQIGECEGIALDAYTANLLSDEEIGQVLAGGVLLDAGAAEILSSRGFAKEIGVRVGKKVECIAGSEVLCTYSHRDGSEVRIPARNIGYKWNCLMPEGAETISKLVTPYGTEYPGFTCYQNPLGGKVYVYAGNGALGDGFYSNYRIRLLKDICSEIAGTRICRLDNASYALCAVKQTGRKRAVFLANMSTDKMERMVLEVPGEVESAVVITADGQECPAEVVGNKVIIPMLELATYEALVCMISVKQ